MEKYIDQCYNNHPNCKIKYNESSGNNLAYIYCSSNALYKPEKFKEQIIENDRYEWMNVSALEKPAKEIFIRDIYLSWYVKGINNTINSYNSLIDFLKKETEGYIVRTVGVSSGGFIATIIAIELHADCCYAIAAQFSLRNHFEHLQTNKYLNEWLTNNGDYWFETYRRMRNLNTRIVYLLPSKSEQDIEQYNTLPKCDNDRILVIKVNDKNHGIPLHPYALPYFLSMSYEVLSSYYRQGLTYNKVFQSIRLGGGKEFYNLVYQKDKV